jgi:hypothetical protein
MLVAAKTMLNKKHFCAWAIGWCVSLAFAQSMTGIKVTQAQIQDIEILGHYDNSLGSSESASKGVISSEVLVSRALLRPAEILEYIPGMVVTQHSGDGKANQYFLRGMNLDHGTDFATTLNGMPINMPTHAHGQGYSDLNFLIPELVNQVEYKKGPYYAESGDFSSAGSAHITYRTRLKEAFSELSLGLHGYQRAVAANTTTLNDSLHLISAIERMNNNGPWTTPEGLRKTNALVSLSEGSKSNGWSSLFSAYQAHWNSTDQIPSRLLGERQYQGQAFGLFDALDPSDGAKTSRLSLSGEWQHLSKTHIDKINWYSIYSDLNIFSNFTYFTDPVNRPYGDQFQQFEKRNVMGGALSRSWLFNDQNPYAFINTLGLQLRQDHIRLGLNNTAQRTLMQHVRDDRVKQLQIGVFAENEMYWQEWLKTIVGLRFDQIDLQVNSSLLPQNSGSAQSMKTSPKFSLVLGPWQRTEFFFNHGQGFHSNDARGVTAKFDPLSKQAIDPVPGLTSSRGQEIGVKTQSIKNLQSTFAIWRLNFASELFYNGETGTTQPGRPSERKGVEMAHHWTPSEQLVLDATLAWTKARYADQDPAGNFIPNAVDKVANLSLSVRHIGPWSGSLGIRYIGSAALIENNTVQSSPSVTTNLRVSNKINPQTDITLDILNLLNRHNNDIAYYYNSRLNGEPLSGVDDLHLHPSELRTYRISTKIKF